MDRRIFPLLQSLICDTSLPAIEDRLLQQFARIPSISLWLTRRPALFSRLPTPLREHIIAHRYRNAARAHLRERELQAILALLHDAGITPALLKGAGFLATQAYPDPALRPPGDLDLWIPPEHMPHALALLREAGYAHIRKCRPLSLYMHYRQEIELVGSRPGSGILDLHYQPFQGWWAILIARIPNASIWKRRYLHRFNSLPVGLLSPEDNVFHLAFHFAINHHFGTPGIQALIDMTISLRTRPVQWKLVRDRAHKWRVRTVLWAVLDLLRHLDPDLIPDAVLKDLQPPRWHRTLLRRLLPGPEALLRPRANEGHGRYPLLFLLCDSPRHWMRLLTWALWPEREWLYLRYGQETPFLRARHVWRVIRYPRF